MKAYRYISLHITREGFKAIATSSDSKQVRYYDNVSVSSAKRIAEIRRRNPGRGLSISDNGNANIAVYSA